MSVALTGLAATFIELEEQTESAVMNVGAVMVFESTPGGGPPSLEDLVARVDERLDAVPRLSQRLSEERTRGWSWPRWIDDERFHTTDHVARVALPSPGNEPELCDWIADFYSHRLNRARPLWEMALIGGVGGDRWGVAIKMHACLLDQVSPSALLALLLDPWPEPEPLTGAPLSATVPPALWRSLVPAPPASIAQAARAGSHAGRTAANALVHPRSTLAQSRALAELIAADELAGAPACSLNQPVGAARRHAAVHCRRADLVAVRHVLGGSFEDVALAACVAGLRELLLERDEKLPDRPLHGMVAIGPPESALDLHSGTLFVELPVAEPGVLVRHRQIVQDRRRLQSMQAEETAGRVIDLTELTPPLLHAVIARLLYGTRLFNVAVSGWYGGTQPRYAFGGKLHEMHPIAPLTAGHTVAIAIATYDDRVTFGLSADRESTPDIAVLAYGIADGIRELYSAACHGHLTPELGAGQPAPAHP